jgi:iron complex outermembrane receptor protein
MSLSATPALAQATAEAGAEEATNPDIVVTARKREESLIDVPVAVTAFSAAELQAVGVKDLQELSRFSPGLSVQNQGANFGGRLISGIRFRGMNPTVFTPSTQVGSLFVDGIYFLGGAQSVGFEDIERVEVIRGPQAAYFGRATFGGAINYITKDPARDGLHAQFSGEYSPSYDSFATAGAVEGPLFGEAITARISASIRQKGAQYTATDGGELGRERTSSANGTLVLRPVERLKIKLRASYSVDDDGPPAFATVSYNRVGNCPRGTPITYLDGSLNERTGALTLPFVCGALPRRGVPISTNTQFPVLPPAITPGRPGQPSQTIPLDVRAVLVDNSYNSPLLAAAPGLDDFGLIRKTQRYAALFDLDLSDAFTLSGNAAINDQRGNSIRDGDNSDTISVFVAAPFIFKDKSAELRLSYDNGPLRAIVGANYYNQKTRQAFANAVEATFGFLIGAAPLSRPNPIGNPSGADTIKTLGFFGSVDWDILPSLTATLEGRYQIDKVGRFSGSELVGLTAEPTITSKKFLPRAILSWHPIEDMTVYGQFAKGTLPGDNTNLAVFKTLTPAQVTEVTSLLGSVATSIPAETLDSYEIGLKQQTLGGRLRYSITGYYMDWKNQKGSATIFLTSGLGRSVAFRVPGTSRVKGVEFEADYSGRNIVLGATANYTDSRYRNFPVASNATFFGSTALVGFNARGNHQPRFPKWSGTASATYRDDFNADWGYYARGDILYTGKTFTDELNLTWVRAFTTVNARLGFVQNDALTLELFATNLFNRRGWQTGAGGTDLSLASTITLPLQRGAQVTPIDRRAVGARVAYKF